MLNDNRSIVWASCIIKKKIVALLSHLIWSGCNCRWLHVWGLHFRFRGFNHIFIRKRFIFHLIMTRRHKFNNFFLFLAQHFSSWLLNKISTTNYTMHRPKGPQWKFVLRFSSMLKSVKINLKLYLTKLWRLRQTLWRWLGESTANVANFFEFSNLNTWSDIE
jgi:hypothetical protein